MVFFFFIKIIILSKILLKKKPCGQGQIKIAGGPKTKSYDKAHFYTTIYNVFFPLM